MNKIIFVGLALIFTSVTQANASSIPCKKQIAEAAIEKMENSSIVESKGSVTLQGGDAIEKEKGTSWLVGLMYDDPCYATVRVTLEQDSCSVKRVKIVSHECTDN